MPKHIPIDDRAVNASPSSYAAVLRSARPCCAVLYCGCCGMISQ